MQGNEIAIVAMACRFPGAQSPEEFWGNLSRGLEGITTFSEEELLKNGVPLDLIHHPSYVPRTAVLDATDKFDAEFWGINRRDAELMDPQHRLFMECAWQAVERAGYDASTYPGRIAAYAGCSASTYFVFQLLPHFQNTNPMGAFQALLLNDKDYLCTRLAYKMNLKGPAVTVQTACSTSLVAIHFACQSLLNGECDMALAGGSTVALPEREGYTYQDGGVLSPDGHCRAFDAKAKGTASGNGVGVVFLKRLEDAVRDRNPIVAVIKGTAINNDGSDKVGFTAPSVNGQCDVILEAMAVAEVEPETITLVEAHGTGTPLGDPIEVAALTQAYRTSTDKKQYCALGSLKTNLGHMDAAAGVGGFMKAALSLQNKMLPPSLNFESPNPQIDFTESPFAVNTTLREWTSETPRRAAISSFGIGGTNAHVVLEEAPERAESSASRAAQLFVLSAKTETALATSAEKLARHVSENEPSLADVAYTLKVGRQRFNHRASFVAESLEEARKILVARDSQNFHVSKNDSTQAAVAFLFPGQGSQYADMAKGLYETEKVFRDIVDECAPIFDLRKVTAEQINATEFTQPAVFIVEYALAKLLMSWGITPTSMIGHSLGEYVAATLAGVLSVEDALKLVVFRGKLMGDLPAGGGMTSIGLAQAEVTPFLSDQISIAALNAPDSTVVSGSIPALETLESRLKEKNVAHQRLHTSHAFHSSLMDSILPAFRERLSKVRLSAPQIPYVSNLTGNSIRAEEATSPEYWVRHLRESVQFSRGLETLCTRPPGVLLEVGPGRTLSSFARRLPKEKAPKSILSSMRHPQEKASDGRFLLDTIGALWRSGVTIHWPAFYEGETRRREVLPTYPFERKSYWIAAPQAKPKAPTETVEASPSPATADEASFSEIERKVIATWKEFVGVEKVGLNDSFFLIGGDSLVASRITARLKEWFPVELQVRHLLETQTPAKLASAIETLLVEKLEGLSDEEAEALLVQYQ